MSTEKINPYDRIQLVMDHFDLNANAFANRIGLKRTQNLYDLRDGKVKKISIGLANKIVAEFSVINRDWLLDGIGEMLREKLNSEIKEEKHVYRIEAKNINSDSPTQEIFEKYAKTLEKYIEQLESNIQALEAKNLDLKKEKERLLSLQNVSKH